MSSIVGVQFNKKGKTYYFSSNNFKLEKGEKVIVQTERGIQLGEIIEIKENVLKISNEMELKNVVRKALEEDEKNYEQNIEDAKKAIFECEKIINRSNLKMKIINAEYTLDKTQLLFYFYADQRVDFRNLAKELANKYKTRIELRQVGPRDKAKEIGGIGICGRKLCCAEFLDNLETVTINMAKNQNIALNPNKINGLCGRLLCCLKYENEIYENNRKNMPKIGEIIKTKRGKGKVIAIDILSRSYKIIYDNQEIDIVSLEV